MNENMVQGKWNEIKGEIRNMWGKLTDDDIERTKGNAVAIKGLIQQHYGEMKEDAVAKLNGLLGRSETAIADKSEEAKERVRAGVKYDN